MSYGMSAYNTQSYGLGAGRILNFTLAGLLTPSGAVSMRGRFRATLQIDENIGYAAALSALGMLQADEDIIALTAVLSRDGLLQADENVLVKAAIPVTSY